LHSLGESTVPPPLAPAVMLHLLEDVVRLFWPRVTMQPAISCHHN
jgi:hypothetical protein